MLPDDTVGDYLPAVEKNTLPTPQGSKPLYNREHKRGARLSAVWLMQQVPGSGYLAHRKKQRW